MQNRQTGRRHLRHVAAASSRQSQNQIISDEPVSTGHHRIGGERVQLRQVEERDVVRAAIAARTVQVTHGEGGLSATSLHRAVAPSRQLRLVGVGHRIGSDVDDALNQPLGLQETHVRDELARQLDRRELAVPVLLVFESPKDAIRQAVRVLVHFNLTFP